MSQGGDDNFIRGFVRLCIGDDESKPDTEIPGIFAMWSGIAGISCALGRRMWIDMGTYRVYPNFFIVFVASSGRFRKSTSVLMIERILRMLNPVPNIIAQKITPEALIEAVKCTAVDVEKQSIQDEATGFVLVDELSSFLNKDSYQAGLAPLLIQFYDCKDTFEYRTKQRGIERINNACLGLLGASTVDWIRNAVPEDAVGGGLTSRMVFVYVDKPSPPVAITTFSDKKKRLLERLVQQLNSITTIGGEARLTGNALRYFESEYNEFYHNSKLYDDKNLAGYASRRHVHLLKLGMIISAAQRNDRIITEHDLRGGEELLRHSEASMKLVLNLITASDAGSTLGFVLQIIQAKGKLSRSELLGSVSHRIGARELTEICDTLIASGKIEVKQENYGGKMGIYYTAIRERKG